MPTAAELAAMMPPVPGLDPGQAQAANEATNAFLNQPQPGATPPPNPFATPSPEELQRMGIAFPAMSVPDAQSAANQFMSPPVMTPPAPPQQPVAPQAPVPVPKPHADSHAQPGFLQQYDKMQAENMAGQQAANQDQVQAINQGSQDIGNAQGEKSKERLALADELIKAQHKVQEHNAALDAIDKTNLDKAKNATIPDFWKNRTGALVGSTISVALAGIGAGLLGSTNNEALKNVQHNIDQYMFQQKERIDNLYKYAEQTGKLNAQTRMQYAQDLLNLKDQHSYLMQSAADHVDEVATKAKGAADAAAQKFIGTQLRDKAQQGFIESRKTRSQMMLQDAEAQNLRASAAEHQARAANGGYFTPQQQIQMLKFADSGFKPFRDEAIGKGSQPGPVTKLAAVEQVKEQFKQALASRDPNRISAAATEVVEKVGPLLAGGKTTGNLTKMIKDMNTLGGQIQGNIGKLTGGNPLGDDMANRMLGLLDNSAHEAKNLAGDIFNRATQEHLGPGGKAGNPELKKRFLDNMRGTFGTATYEGQPLFNITDQPQQPGQPAPAAPPAMPSTGAAGGLVTIRNKTTGETKQVTEAEARSLGAIK